MSGKNPERRGLGRGLSALMADASLGQRGDDADRARTRGVRVLPIEVLRPNPDQPRRAFSRAELEGLAASIREKGIIQPLIVRPDPADPALYQIVAGERRWRAAQMVAQHEVPVVIRKLNDTEALEVAIIENIQRADLNPIEEAQGYHQLMTRFGHTQERLAEALGKSRSHVANQLRLLQLPEEILDDLREGRLSAGHARALITTKNPIELARTAIRKGLSVREVERLAKGREAVAKPAPAVKPMAKDADTLALEADLSANLGLPVTVEHHAGSEKGTLSIHYGTLAELDEICRVLTAMPAKIQR